MPKTPRGIKISIHMNIFIFVFLSLKLISNKPE